jgi:hypothetical protein
VDALLRDDAQARLLELGVDLAGQVALGGVGLDDRKRAFGGHVCGAPWEGGAPGARLNNGAAA